MAAILAKSKPLSAFDPEITDLLALLALTGAVNISNLARLAALLDLRQSATRAHSTVSLRELLEPSLTAGWLRHGGGGYEVPVLRLFSVLRHTHCQGRLARVVTYAGISQRGVSYGNMLSNAPKLALLQLVSQDPNCEATLLSLVGRSTHADVARVVLSPAFAYEFDVAGARYKK